MSPGSNATFSSSLLRERDQKILEKHAKEKSELEFRIQKLKEVNDARAKELFDALHRGDRLARCIGFDNLYEAQVYLDSLENSITFKECIDRIRILEAELNCEKKEVEILQAKLDKAGDNSRLHVESERLKTELSNAERRHREELKQLQERYDSLRDFKERAAERYKSDFKKWRQFSKWLFAEDDAHHKRRHEPGISKEERKRRDMESVMRKRKNMIEMGPDLARYEGEPDDSEGFLHPPPIGCTELEADKENDPTPSTSQKRSHASSENSASPSRPLQNIQPKDVNVHSRPSSPASFFTTGPPATSRTLFSCQPMQIKQEPETTPTFVGSRNAKRPHMPSSSDTEEDSQAVAFPSTNPRSGKLAVFKVPPPPMAFGDPPSVARPRSAQEATNSRNSSHVEDAQRPSKVRRLSDDSTPFTWLQDDQDTPCPSKGKKKHENNVATPLNGGESSRRRDDYSAFKGRGRYSGQIQNPEETINAVYAIDPKSNGGKNYQYDEVVRNKDQRQKMHGGDCECCREYYKNVGPLPKRLQQPLWRSPSKITSKSHHDRSDTPRRQVAHQQAISRHRQTWARAKTPPGYWEIGFPNTQEVGDINKQAKEMEKKKKMEIENESNRDGGRYRKK